MKTTNKRQLLGDVVHYYVELNSGDAKKAIVAHFDKYPLMGHKMVTYSRWYNHVNGK